MPNGNTVFCDNLLLTMILIAFSTLSAMSMTLQGACASEITDVSYSGRCGDFTVIISADGLYDDIDYAQACWDAKVDVPGRIFDGSEGESGQWKSSFYYVKDAICPPEQQATLYIRPSSIAPLVEGTVRLRQDERIIEAELVIEQDCPQPLGWEWVLIGAAAFIIFFGYLLAWWMKKK